MIDVVLAEDHDLIRSALVALLSLEDDVRVVAELSRGDEIVAAVARLEPHVAILDVDLPVLDGIAAAATLRRVHPRTGVLILTNLGRPAVLRRALAAGALGFLQKTVQADELISAVRRVSVGERAIDTDLAAQTIAAPDCTLTRRELDVLAHIAQGSTVNEVARTLFLSAGTVRNYLSAAISKTNARNRLDAVNIARARGWI
ncbi:response regulator transcription factor [Frankia sp. Cr2]|uniref:response regulator transcription factor n=1 Tax=Frankia sp. Cr2 TaxID=3073932 RepID=UPI002AD3F3BA|nr:response regulator transcription factor [Frankia sp. Cr2]